MTATPLCRIFGVRHLSPAGARHLLTVLRKVEPTAILIEGPSDGTEMARALVHKETEPPVAMLFYTRERPVRSILYPLAAYSPEWVALSYGVKHGIETRLIDLPSSVFLQLHQQRTEPPENADGTQPEVIPEAVAAASEHTVAYMNDPYGEIARISGEVDHETWWEKTFEHTTDAASYSGQMDVFGAELRTLRPMQPDDENLVREAWMRRNIREILSQGHEPDKVVVVCGAFHSSALIEELPSMTEAEAAALPRIASSITLMPYSYKRLSSQSGYGAGNRAPAYYEMLHDEFNADEPGTLSARFMAELAHMVRRDGHMRSAAEVIEGVRLADSLAAMADCSSPTLRDLRDAATICLGRGETTILQSPLHRLLIGSKVGRLPKSLIRTAIQEDFRLCLEEHNLDQYLKDEDQEVELDLRENRYVKTREAAYRDLNRSTFLHRLTLLGIGFGKQKELRDRKNTWKEVWTIRWTPECEMHLVEASLLADSVESAAVVKLSMQLAESADIVASAHLVRQAAECELASALENASRRLQGLVIDETGFTQLARACEPLADLLRYGSVRKLDFSALGPLIGQLFLRACFGIRNACLCDDAAARDAIKPAILKLHDLTVFLPEMVDGPRWLDELDFIASADHVNCYVSGFVMSLILTRIDEPRLAAEVSRRLSPGVPPELGSNWFEGLVQYNPQALMERVALWRQMDQYLIGLDAEQFRTSLVPLRRAFSSFGKAMVRRIISNLAELMPGTAKELYRSVETPLTEDEVASLNELLGGLDLGAI